MKKTTRVILMFLFLPGVLSLLDLDQDGYCEDKEFSCKFDYCPNTEPGALIDGYGCSCDQKTIPGCNEEYCCPENSNPCVSSCAEHHFNAFCTNGTENNRCGEYRECPADGCYSSEQTYWNDFPASGHDSCENGVCVEHSCNATGKILNDTRCDYEYCEKTFGVEYSCQDSGYIGTECDGKGKLIRNSSCAIIGGGSGMCTRCGSSCSDSDRGLNTLVKGSVTYHTETFEDYCHDSKTLIEYYCDRDGEKREYEYSCSVWSKICENGICDYSRKEEYGEECDNAYQCKPELSCVADPTGNAQRCCNSGQCYGFSGCVDSYEDIVFDDDEYRCMKGRWVEKQDLLGCYITDTECNGTKIFTLENAVDSHASLPGENTFHGYSLCCESNKISIGTSGTHLMSLSNPSDDAHVSLFETSAFPNKIYANTDVGSMQCTVRTSCGFGDIQEECVLSLSDDIDNAHIGDCENPDFENKLCCSLQENNVDTMPPAMKVSYDGETITVLTNEYAECRLKGGGDKIPCSNNYCLKHVLDKEIRSNDYVICKDKNNNTASAKKFGVCRDGTPYDSCSAKQPLTCSQKGLEEDCNKCGCPSESPHCEDDGTCSSLDCLESTPTKGSGMSKGLLSLNDPIVRQTAEKALEEYADLKNVEKESLNTADEYIEAVAYYVNKNMRWIDCLPYKQAARIIGESGSMNCGKKFCGCCTNHAVLRTALLRSLGVEKDCVFTAHGGSQVDGPGHEYNIVKYKGAYRIMDYGFIGRYFVTRWQYHVTDGLWNDYMGSFRPYVNPLPAQFTYNYPINSIHYPEKCRPSGWTYDTYYTDVCP